MKIKKANLLKLLFSASLFIASNALAECIDDQGNPTYDDNKTECEEYGGTWISKTTIIALNKAQDNEIIEYNSKLYYSATDTTHGEEFWVTDGTIPGTKLVKDIDTGSRDSRPDSYIEFNNKLYFTADADLYESDGTDAGTLLVHSTSISNAIIYNNKLYFSGYVDNTYSNELYSSDGTTDSTELVKDIHSSGGSYPSYFSVFDNKLFFRANDGVNGYELWVSDGTADGTTLLKDIKVGDSSDYGNPRYLTVFDNKLFFSADDGINGYELWVSDGTADGTTLFKDIKTGGSSDSSSPSDLIVSNNKLFFSANDGTNGSELWVSDGTVDGTILLKNIYPSSSSSPRYLTNFNSKLYFQASDSNGYGLWVSDGTEEGTTKIVSLEDSLQTIYAGSDKLYFITNDGYIYQTDGTAENTRNIYKEDVTIADDTPFSNITFSQDEAKDISVTLTLGDNTKGSLSATTIASTDMASAQAALHAITYNSNGGSYTEKITITVDDGANTSSYVHYIVVSLPINTASSNINITIDEDTSKTFSENDFSYTGELTLSHVIITTLESAGALKLDGVDVTLNQEIAVADLSNLVFTPAENANGTAYATFGFKVKDSNMTSTDAYTATINVTAVDDAPTIDMTTVHNNISNSESYSIELNSNDIDGDTIGYTASSLDTTKANVSIENGNLVVTPIDGAEGTVTVELYAVSNGKVTSQEITIDLTTPTLTSYDNLKASKWNMISLPKGKILDTTKLVGITDGEAVKIYRDGTWIENPTEVTAKEAIWVNPTSTTLDLSVATDDTTNDFASKAAQLEYYKTLSTNEWHFVGVQYTINWSDLTKSVITPDTCEGYTFVKYYDSTNDSWNTTSNIPAGAGIWLRHLCN